MLTPNPFMNDHHDPAPQNATNDGPARKVVFTWADEIADDVPTWAWNYGGLGRIAVGTVAILAGRPGAGKSTSARWLVAQATTGTLPGAWLGKPVKAAYLAREESISYIVKPSLRAHGADLTRVAFPSVEIVGEGGKLETTVSVSDMHAFKEMCLEHEIRMVVVDPLMAMLGAKTDAHRSNEVRAQLDPWRMLAEGIDGVVLGVAHLNKSGGGDVVAGINGSSAFGEVARAVFGFTKDPDSESGERVMSQEKNSMGDESLALTYRIDPREVTTSTGKTADVGQFVLLGDSDRSVGDVLRDAGRGRAEDADTTERDSAADWLRSYLQAKVVDSKEAKQDGKTAGFSERTLQRARQELNVIIAPDGRRSTWSLPTGATGTGDVEAGTGGTGHISAGQTIKTTYATPVPRGTGGTGSSSGPVPGGTDSGTGNNGRSGAINDPKYAPVPPMPTSPSGLGTDATDDSCRVCGQALLIPNGTGVCARRDDAHDAARNSLTAWKGKS